MFIFCCLNLIIKVVFILNVLSQDLTPLFLIMGVPRVLKSSAPLYPVIEIIYTGEIGRASCRERV